MATLISLGKLRRSRDLKEFDLDKLPLITDDYIYVLVGYRSLNHAPFILSNQKKLFFLLAAIRSFSIAPLRHVASLHFSVCVAPTSLL